MSGPKPEVVDPLAQYLPEDHDPLAHFLEQKNPNGVNDLLGEITTATAPSSTAIAPPTPEGIVQQQSVEPVTTVPEQARIATEHAKNEKIRNARLPVKYTQGTAENLINYGANRAADVINHVQDAAAGTVGLFMDPTSTTDFAARSIAGLAAIPGAVVDTFRKNGVKQTLLGNFANDMIIKPLGTFVDHLIGTPLNQAIVQPYHIITTGTTSDSDEEMRLASKEAIPDIAATFVGAKVGMMIKELQLTDNAAGMLAKKLAINPATIGSSEKLASALAAMPTDEVVALSKELPTLVRAQQFASKVIAESAAAGAAAGIAMPATPEEKFSNGFMMAVMGIPFVAGLHGVFHAAESAGIFRSGESFVREAAGQRLQDLQLQDLAGLPPSESFRVGSHFVQGLSAPEIIARNIDHGIIYNVPTDVRNTLGDHGYTWFDHGDGTHSALVDRNGAVDPAAYQTYTQDIEKRAASATAQADEILLRELEISDPIAHANIERLRASGDISAAESLMRALDQRDFMRRELFKDPTTQIANRRAFDLALPKAEADPNAHILVSDLDGFKAANDTHGHPAGDEVLKNFGLYVRGIMEKYHLPIRDVFRTGGDEFATIINTPDKLLVERIKKEIDLFKHTVDSNNGKPPVDVTPSTGSGPTYGAADAAMYDAKNLKKGIPPQVAKIIAPPPDEGLFSKADKAHFQATGFLPFEKVSYNGKNWYVHKIAGEVAQLLDQDGNSTTAKLKELRRLPSLEVATPHLDINQVLEAPIDEANIPKEPTFKRVVGDEKVNFRAELIKPLESIDPKAKAMPDQPAYSIDPDVQSARPKSKYGIPIDFASDFDKAVWHIIRVAGEMKNLGETRKLQVETRALQFAKKVGIPMKELLDHKMKLMNEVAKATQDYDIELREIGMEPGADKSQAFIGIGAQKFDGAGSKFRGIDYEKVGKTVNAGKFTDLPLTPEEQGIIEQNKAAYDAHNKDILRGIVREINDNGMRVAMVGDKAHVIGPDGKVVATFRTIDEALQYRQQGSNRANTGKSSFTTARDGGTGDVVPPVDVGDGNSGQGNIPPTSGNIQDSGYWDPLGEEGKPNIINLVVGGLQQARQGFLKPRQGYFRDLAAQLGLPDIHVSSLSLDAAAMKANAEITRANLEIKRIAKQAAKLGAMRIRYAVGGWLRAGSLDDSMSNVPGRRIDIARPTSIQEFTKGAELAKLVRNATQEGEIPTDILGRASRFVAAKAELLKRFATEQAQQSPEFIDHMSKLDAILANTPGLDKVITSLEEIVKRPKTDMDIFQVVILAEQELTNSLSKADFAKTQGMSPQELDVGQKIRNFINERAIAAGQQGDLLSKKMDLVGRYSGGTYNGSLFSLQASNNAAEAGFMGQLVRDINNVDFEHDPFKAANNVANTSIRNKILQPAIEDYTESASKVDRDIRARGQQEALLKNNKTLAGKYNKIAAEYTKNARNYADEVQGRMTGMDATLNHAVGSMIDHFSEQAKIANEKFAKYTGQEVKGGEVSEGQKYSTINVKNDVVSPINRIIELAAQGAKPAAGIMDQAYILLKMSAELPIHRFVKVLSVISKAADQAAELQKQGKIAGLQAVIPEDISTISAKNFGARQVLDNASDIGFSLSLQPSVFKYNSAALWVENVGATVDAFKKYGGNTPESITKIVKELGMRKLGPAVRMEFARLAMAGQQDAASEFYARAMQHYMIVQYGRANHPMGFGTTVGRLLGTFGTWPLGAVDSFMQTAQYGSYKDIGVYAAKAGLMYWGIKKMQDDSGLNLRRYMYNPLDFLTWRGSPMVGAAGALLQYGYATTSGNDKLKAEAEWQLSGYLPNGSKDAQGFDKLVPFSSDDPNWNSIFVPWSFGMQNNREAYEELTNGNIIQAMLREMQIRPIKK